ncbi:patatin family protein [Lachnospiraceae bacterium 46-15]
MYQGAMILEGGAIRGVFTAGALDFLLDKKFMIEKVIGVSAGASNGLNFVAGQKGRMLECTVREGENEEKLIDLKKAIRTGSLFDMDLIYDRDPRENHPFDFAAFFASPMELEITVTNCLTGEAEYLTEREDEERLMLLARASSSIPLAAPKTVVDGVPYLDGGMADSIPLLHSMREGNRKNILILTREKGYRKKVSKKSAALYQAAFRKYPEMAKCSSLRPLNYNRTLELVEKWEDEGRVFVIRPQIPTISRTESDADAIKAFYHHGYEEMERRYEELLKFLEE